MKIKRTIILFITLICGFSSHAQKIDYYKKYSEKYKGETSILLTNKEKIEISNNNGELQIEIFNGQSTLVLEKKPYPVKAESVQYNSFMPMSDLKAETLIPKENGGYTAKKVTNFRDVDQLSSSIFYDDTRRKSFEYEDITMGSILKYSYKNKLNEPRFLSSFMFSNYLPIMESEIVISYPNTVTLTFNKFNMDTLKYKEKRWKKGKTNYVSFRAVNVEKYDYEPDAPTARYFMPHISYYITSFKNKEGESEELLGGVKDLHKWYSELIKYYDTAAISDELAGIVDSLFSEGDNEIAKVKKVFYWVQDNIKYIAFEDGMRGFVPSSGNFICSNRFGDCKDMASIINKMLNYAGVNSHLVWIGTRHVPYKYEEMPTPSVDNHMIAAYRFQDSIMFLDATASYLPFGMPNAFIQGKEALVHENSVTFKVETVPIVKGDINFRKDTTYLTYKDGKLLGRASTKLGGFRRMYLIMRTGFSKEIDKEKFYKRLLSKANADCIVEDIKETNLLNKDTSLNFDYSLKINGYAQAVDNGLYVNMNLEKRTLPSKIDLKRKVPVQFDFKKTDNIVFYLEIPEGYKMNYLPENSNFKGVYFDYNISYEKENNKIKYILFLEQKSMFLEPVEFSKYNEELVNLHLKFRESTIFKK